MTERVVITGANRGLGLALAHRYHERGDVVLAGCRRPGDAAELRALTDHVHALDLGDEASIDAFAAALGDDAIDVLINNGGIDGRSLGAGDDDRDVLQLSPEHFMGEIRVNTLGPLLLVRALLDRLQAAARPRIVNVSSQVGSMEIAARMGRDIGYTASKAALNMVSVKLAGRLREDGVVVVSLHPGYLRTDMGSASADLDPAEAAADIADLADRLTLAESGSFLRWDGSVHPW
jgi:NAD(P)-dependent dehydrogenase (short-subunit alcohol dehydrogenase family)